VGGPETASRHERIGPRPAPDRSARQGRGYDPPGVTVGSIDWRAIPFESSAEAGRPSPWRPLIILSPTLAGQVPTWETIACTGPPEIDSASADPTPRRERSPRAAAPDSFDSILSRWPRATERCSRRRAHRPPSPDSATGDVGGARSGSQEGGDLEESENGCRLERGEPRNRTDMTSSACSGDSYIRCCGRCGVPRPPAFACSASLSGLREADGEFLPGHARLSTAFNDTIVEESTLPRESAERDVGPSGPSPTGAAMRRVHRPFLGRSANGWRQARGVTSFASQ